jgi:pyruvate dehydrogenase (quinone)/pyruvate oxidase
MHAISGNLGSSGCGLPYAIAAQVAYPERPCIAFVGDNGFSTLMAEFSTCVKYGLPIKVVLLKCNAYGLSRWEEEADYRLKIDDLPLEKGEAGSSPFERIRNDGTGVALEIAEDFQPIDFAGFARDCGGAGFSIKTPAECGPTLEKAFLTPGPVLIEVLVDSKEAPLPPRPTPKPAE